MTRPAPQAELESDRCGRRDESVHTLCWGSWKCVAVPHVASAGLLRDGRISRVWHAPGQAAEDDLGLGTRAKQLPGGDCAAHVVLGRLTIENRKRGSRRCATHGEKL